MFGFWRKQSPCAAFMARFAGRTIIVHRGFALDWLDELLKQPGGAGHFRLDARERPGARPTPIEWVVHEHVLPLGLPLPLLVKVSQEGLRVRHLTRAGIAMHPSEIAWLLDEIEARHHVLLRRRGEDFDPVRVMDVGDNAIDTPYGFSL